MKSISKQNYDLGIWFGDNPFSKKFCSFMRAWIQFFGILKYNYVSSDYN